jgi:hypothetical protein
MQVRAKAIVNWVEHNLPPLSWQIIVMQNMKMFIKHKLQPSKFDEATFLNVEVVQSIGACIRERYNKELPTTLR